MKAIVIALAVAVIGNGCGSSAESPPAQSDAPGDANILDVLRTVHEGEVSLGTYALERATDGRVKELAQRMVSEHDEALAHERRLASQMGVAPVAHEISNGLQKHTDDTRKSLRDRDAGLDFDKAYVAAMVDGHEGVLALIRDKLAPRATSNALKTELSGLEATVTSHLAHARSLAETVK